jgi:hypothetical protein
MAKKNQFTQPAAPPPPMFINQPERDFNKQIVTEVAERVSGQPILYYPIDIDSTDFHPLYGEAITKTFLPPVRVYAFVEFSGKYIETKVDKFGLEKDTTMTVHFHKRRLTEDQDLYVREGDFVLHNGVLYEIVKLSEPASPYGQTENRVEITATCIKSRKGLFNAQ